MVLPSPVRRKLGLRPGDPLDVTAENGRVVLTPRKVRSRKAKICVDPVTGLPVLIAGPNALPLTSEQVEEILSSFP